MFGTILIGLGGMGAWPSAVRTLLGLLALAVLVFVVVFLVNTYRSSR